MHNHAFCLNTFNKQTISKYISQQYAAFQKNTKQILTTYCVHCDMHNIYTKNPRNMRAELCLEIRGAILRHSCLCWRRQCALMVPVLLACTVKTLSTLQHPLATNAFSKRTCMYVTPYSTTHVGVMLVVHKQNWYYKLILNYALPITESALWKETVSKDTCKSERWIASGLAYCIDLHLRRQ